MAGNCCNNTSSCGGFVYPSTCVVWADEAISKHNIEKGDNLNYIVTTITDELDLLYSADNINLDSLDLSNCKAISDLIGTKKKTVGNVVQVLVDYQCTLKSYIDEKTSGDPISYDTKCLSPTGSKESDIIQATIDQTCINKSNISALNTAVDKNTSDIKSLKSSVNSILGDSTSQPVFTFSQLMLPWVPMPYLGSLSNFDSSGKGKAENGFKDVYIMNGQNGTDDWRGYTPVGANDGIPGGSLDSRVDPTKNNGFKLGKGQKTGELYHKLSVTEIPSHSHGVNDPGHSHTYNSLSVAGHPRGSDQNNLRWQKTDQTSVEKTNISIKSSGGGQAHNNVQPSTGVVWIIKLP